MHAAGAMLALDDAALLRLCLGASRLRTGAARVRLLHKFSYAADPPRRVVQERQRTLRKRARRKAEVRVYALPLPDRTVEGLLNTLVANGRLTEAAAGDKQQINRALAWLLTELERYWATI